MNQQRRNTINNQCEELIRKYHHRVNGFVVDVEALVNDLGGKLTVLTDDHLEFEAQISKDGDSFQIVLQEGVMQQRQRFSIAHELGHLFLHMGFSTSHEKTTLWNQTPDGEGSAMARCGSGELEYEANEFAGALLMPRQQYEQIMDQNTNWANETVNIGGIAKTFEVSSKAARLRGQWLGLLEWT